MKSCGRLAILLMVCGFLAGCSDVELAVTCKNGDGLDRVAMRNTPYVHYFESEDDILRAERQIKEIRAWAKKQDRCTRTAYEKWLDSAQWMIGEVRKDNAQNEKANRESRGVPVPPHSGEVRR